MTPQEARRNIGAKVVYLSFSEDVAERGVITGVSESGWVFVKYGHDMHSKATAASHLQLEKSHRVTCPTTYGESCDGYCDGVS